MEFSVVITTYNRLDLLKRAIDSALGQTLPCQVVVADDCSTDGTEEYVRNWVSQLQARGDDRLVYHRNAENAGHAATMNSGVKQATGEWIKPLDDDDYLASNCLEKMAEAIALRPQAAICSAQAAQVDINEVELSRTIVAGPGKAFYIPQEDVHYGMLLELVPVGTPAQVSFRKDAFWQAGGWDSAFDGNCDDIDSWIKMSQFGDVIFINECLAYRTVWTGAYNRRFSVQKRLDTNMLMKQRIYTLVSPKYQSFVPPMEDVRAYLNLHWGLVAVKHGKIFTGIETMFPSVFSWGAWRLLVRALWFRWFAPDRSVKEIDAYNLSFTENLSELEAEGRSSDSLSRRLWWFSRDRGQPATTLKKMALPTFADIWQQKSSSIEKSTDEENFANLKERLERNIWLIEQIYCSLDEQHCDLVPELRIIKNYLKLCWGGVAIGRGKLLAGVRLGFPAAFSIAAWQLLFESWRSQRQSQYKDAIRKLVLIEN
mgnify:CR=1 FL=1